MAGQWTDVLMEMTLLMAHLEAESDPDYAATLRRSARSSLATHGTPVAAVHQLARDWFDTRSDVPVEVLFDACEMLWATGWREERIVAVDLHRWSRPAIAAADWSRVERWSRDVDGWELADHLARLTGPLLLAAPRRHFPAVRLLATSDRPWQRRLALVTLIAASRDAAWLPELEAMIERLDQDPAPPVRSAVRRARRLLARRRPPRR